jgi:rhodanese-related sulfurtransferase
MKMDYEITINELKARLDAREAVTILDVREPWEYDTARIDGSRHIPMADVPARANQELDREAHVVVICHHGIRSLRVTSWLRQQGFERAQSLRGGIDQWSRAIDPRVPVY